MLRSSIQMFIIVRQLYLVSYGDVAFPALFQRQAKCECICLQCQAQPRCLPPANHPGSHRGLACSRMAATRIILVIPYCLKIVLTEKCLETSWVYPSLAFSLPERGVPPRAARGGRPGQARPLRQPCCKAPAPRPHLLGGRAHLFSTLSHTPDTITQQAGPAQDCRARPSIPKSLTAPRAGLKWGPGEGRGGPRWGWAGQGRL